MNTCRPPVIVIVWCDFHFIYPDTVRVAIIITVIPNRTIVIIPKKAITNICQTIISKIPFATIL